MSASSPREFHCRQCGACCRVPGRVHLLHGEETSLARCLGLDVLDFTARCAALAPDRRGLVLKDKPNGACILLDDAGRCTAHAAKPRQCRDFPFSWRNADSAAVCPGLNQGQA
jgi:Fe-S-cluster containining protein